MREQEITRNEAHITKANRCELYIYLEWLRMKLQATEDEEIVQKRKAPNV